MKTWFFSIVFMLFGAGILFQAFGESTVITSYLANLLFHHNFHEVVPGKLYRSSEMSREDLGQLIDTYHIQSVIDLRINEDEPDESGKTEAETTAAHQAQYRHIPFSSARADQRESFVQLLDAYQTLPTPILVHCSSGTHRSGVASAVYLIDQQGTSSAEAALQLTTKYGFFQFERDIKEFFQKKPTLDKVLGAYAATGEKSGQSFREWVKSAPILGHAAHTPSSTH